MKTYLKFPLLPMGVLVPRLRTLDGTAHPPIDASNVSYDH